MLSKNKLARISGFIYLLLILTGIFGIVFVPSSLIVWTSSETTVSNIIGSDFLFRLGIFSEIICFLAFIALPLFLYQLFKTVNRTAAILMVIFALISVPITFSNILNKINVLSLLSGEKYLEAIPQEQLHAQVMYQLAAFNNGTMLANIFWGAWLLPLGYLVFKSNFLPKILGVFLMIGCFSYIIEFICKFLFSFTQIPWYVSVPSSVGEFGICIWLIAFGVKGKTLSHSP